MKNKENSFETIEDLSSIYRINPKTLVLLLFCFVIVVDFFFNFLGFCGFLAFVNKAQITFDLSNQKFFVT